MNCNANANFSVPNKPSLGIGSGHLLLHFCFDFDTFKNDTFKSVIFRYVFSEMTIETILTLLEKILILTLSKMTLLKVYEEMPTAKMMKSNF